MSYELHNFEDGKILNATALNEMEQGIENKIDKDAFLDAGIKSISWIVSRSEINVTTVEDPYKSQRPSGTNTRYWAEFEGCPYFKNRNLYKVTFNGVIYDNLVCKYGILIDNGTSGKDPNSTAEDGDIGGSWNIIGNKYLYDSRYENTGEPFALIYLEHGGMNIDGSYYYGYKIGNGILFTSSASINTLKIEKATIEISQLNQALITRNFGDLDELSSPYASSTYSPISLGMGNISIRNGISIGYDNIASNGMNVAIGSLNESAGDFSISIGHNTISNGICSFSEGQSTKSSNFCSHAEGSNTTASGEISHAEGQSTSATSICSHSEGRTTKATGENSHAEGMLNIASGINTHAEGQHNEASGQGAHSEGGYCLSSGSQSHSEGQYSLAGGHTSHVEGQGNQTLARTSHIEGTGNKLTTNGQFTHVQGINALDPNELSGKSYSVTLYKTDGTISSTNNRTPGKYAHIVGNGKSDTERSNAHTLDWDGNSWYAGNVTAAGGNITIGSTTITEDQLKSLLALLNT